jgi:hypothetical protein
METSWNVYMNLEGTVALFKVLSKNLQWGTEKTMNTLRRDSRYQAPKSEPDITHIKISRGW